MSATALIEESSAIDRAEIRTRLEALERDFREHIEDSKRLEQDIVGKLDKLLELRAQIRMLATVLVLSLGTALVFGQWAVRHAVTDVLTDQGLILWERGK
jgi:hypothetical protein